MKFRRIVKELIRQASEQMLEPSSRVRMERRILAEQRGLVWFGGIMAFKHVGLVVAGRDGATPFMWGKEQYSLTGDTGKLDKFVEGFLKFSADHLRPHIGCGLGDIEKYSHLLMEKFADIFGLKPAARENYVVPHAFRKYCLRLETLIYPI